MRDGDGWMEMRRGLRVRYEHWDGMGVAIGFDLIWT